MSPLRVAFVSQWYAPEPVIQPGWVVQALRRAGAQVEVLTGVPNYPSGRVLPGYAARSLRTETVDGVRVHRTPLVPGHGSRALGRLANYASWAVSSAVFGQRMLGAADVALVYSSPATAALPAMVARRRARTPYVLMVQDVWPDSAFASGFLAGPVGRLLSGPLNAFVERTYRDAAAIVVTSPGMRTLLERRGVPTGKLSVAYNWVEDVEQAPSPSVGSLRGRLGLTDDDFLLMYAGNLGAAQGLRSVISGMAKVPADERCHLVLVGDGVERRALEAHAAQCCPDRVHFVDPVPRAAMAATMADAQVQLVALADRPLFRVTTPSKLQSILAAGHPVLVSAAGDAAAVVVEAGAGLAVSPERPSELAACVRRLRRMSGRELQELGRHGKEFYTMHMSEKTGAQVVMSALRQAAHGEARSSDCRSVVGGRP